MRESSPSELDQLRRENARLQRQQANKSCVRIIDCLVVGHPPHLHIDPRATPVT